MVTQDNSFSGHEENDTRVESTDRRAEVAPARRRWGRLWFWVLMVVALIPLGGVLSARSFLEVAKTDPSGDLIPRASRWVRGGYRVGYLCPFLWGVLPSWERDGMIALHQAFGARLVAGKPALAKVEEHLDFLKTLARQPRWLPLYVSTLVRYGRHEEALAAADGSRDPRVAVGAVAAAVGLGDRDRLRKWLDLCDSSLRRDGNAESSLAFSAEQYVRASQVAVTDNAEPWERTLPTVYRGESERRLGHPVVARQVLRSHLAAMKKEECQKELALFGLTLTGADAPPEDLAFFRERVLPTGFLANLATWLVAVEVAFRHGSHQERGRALQASVDEAVAQARLHFREAGLGDLLRSSNDVGPPERFETARRLLVLDLARASGARQVELRQGLGALMLCQALAHMRLADVEQSKAVLRDAEPYCGLSLPQEDPGRYNGGAAMNHVGLVMLRVFTHEIEGDLAAAERVLSTLDPGLVHHWQETYWSTKARLAFMGGNLEAAREINRRHRLYASPDLQSSVVDNGRFGYRPFQSHAGYYPGLLRARGYSAEEADLFLSCSHDVPLGSLEALMRAHALYIRARVWGDLALAQRRWQRVEACRTMLARDPAVAFLGGSASIPGIEDHDVWPQP